MTKVAPTDEERIVAIFEDYERRLQTLERTPIPIHVGMCLPYVAVIAGAGVIEVKPMWFWANGASFNDADLPELAAEFGTDLVVSTGVHRFPNYTDGRSPVGVGANFPTIGAQGGSRTNLHVHSMQGHVHSMQGHVHSQQGHTHVDPAPTPSTASFDRNLDGVTGQALVSALSGGNTTGPSAADTGGPSTPNTGGPSVGDTGGPTDANILDPYEVCGGWIVYAGRTLNVV